MATYVATDELKRTVSTVRSRISKFRGNKSFNEQNTKASLIVPILQALGWDTNDPDEVHWEYKPKPKYNPVDFALMLKRTPCLLVEAKALRESLSDDKLVAQILTYAAVAGVQWVVLTNGDEYRIYNAAAALPVEDKLFRRVSLSEGERESVEANLILLSKANLEEKKISRLWESHFVDRQVKSALEELLSPEDPSSVVVRAIKKRTQGRLRDSDIRASIRRLRLALDFPAEPEQAQKRATKDSAPPSKPRGTQKPPSAEAKAKSAITVRDLLNAGLLRPSTRISCMYRGHVLEATIQPDGRVAVDGAVYDSLSTAGGMARKPFHRGDLKGRPYPQTNGWTFWMIDDLESGKKRPVDNLRDRYLKQAAIKGKA